jgi:hemolysin III
VYLSVGWLGSIGVVTIGRSVEEHPIQLFVWGGVAFSVGAVVYAVGWPSLWGDVVGAHEVFHVLVLLGAALHFEFIYRHCTAPLHRRDVAPAP